mmetsp:Transcript_100018/g.223453  ORF Transcript_100018/g.223453 Transcript_100018/m.223453 type:complete len:183 (+) Transcript_100018:68-616(+)
MANDTSPDLVNWLGRRLEAERRAVEELHRTLLADVEAKFGAQGPSVQETLQDASSCTAVAAEMPSSESSDVVIQRRGTILTPTLRPDSPAHTRTLKNMLKRSQTGSLGKKFKKKEPGGTAFQRVVGSMQFELFFSSMIVLNTLVLALDIQFSGVDLGFDIGYMKGTPWPDISAFFSSRRRLV